MSSPDLSAVEFLTYNRWANLTLIDALRHLPQEQLAATIPGSYGSIYETLAHIVRGEASYYHRLTGKRLKPPFAWDDRPTITAIRPYAEQVSTALLEAASELTSLDRIVVEKDENETYRYKAMTLFIQAINHGIEHRTNITTILAQLGLEPPGIDGWGYLEAHPDRLGA